MLIRDLLDWSAPAPGRLAQSLAAGRGQVGHATIPAPTASMRPFNIDAKLNGAYIAFGLLFGGGDFAADDGNLDPLRPGLGLQSLERRRRARRDARLRRAFPRSSKAELPTRSPTPKFDFTDYSFNDIVKSTEARALKVIRTTGGTGHRLEVVDPDADAQGAEAGTVDAPASPTAASPARDPAWTWTGPWKRRRRTVRVSGRRRQRGHAQVRRRRRRRARAARPARRPRRRLPRRPEAEGASRCLHRPEHPRQRPLAGLRLEAGRRTRSASSPRGRRTLAPRANRSPSARPASTAQPK